MDENEIERLRAELEQSEKDAEQWRLISESWRDLCAGFQAGAAHWQGLYRDAYMRAGPLAGELADGGTFHEWFERNLK